YTEVVMSHTKNLQEKLFNEMKGRIKEDENTVPYKKGDYWYYERYIPGGEYAIYCRKKGSLDAKEEIIIDGNELGKNEEFLSFYVVMSHDASKACIIADVEGRNFYTIRIKDMKTGKFLKDKIENTRGGCEWTTDDKALIYGVPDPKTLRVYKFKKHVIGKDTNTDVVLLEEKDETLDGYVYNSRSEKYLFVTFGRTDADIMLYTDAANPVSFTVITPLQENVIYYADHTEGDRFLIHTNYKAVNYRLVSTPISNGAKENWKDVLSHRDDVFLSGTQFFENYIVAEEVKEGLTKLRVLKRGGTEDNIVFDEEAYYATLGYNPEYKSENIRFGYSSLITPYSIYEYNTNTKEKKLLKQEEIPSGYDKTRYATERMMVPARDGKKIPMAVVYRKDLFKKDGTNPGFIYGYGAYGSSNEDYFNSDILSLLDRGFVYANTHIRGGQEMGGQWYEDGKMLKKKNTFYDFIDCSEHLIHHKYVAVDKLFANGGSAGGLLMGAITNMRPDLYRGIIADVPFVDAMTTMEDETIPLTTFEWLEWGNPKIKEQYDYMLTYSPYDNVEKKEYPNILVTTGFNDSQVQYFEPAKWVAKLRHMKTDDNLLIFKINMDAGHGGNSGRYESLKEIALDYAFMLDILGKKE
ncbi:MAG: S9 family peptidase, partial [Chitinophagales bacterium]